MALIVYSKHALADLDRLAEFLVDQNPEQAEQTGALITGAIDVLELHPFVGRLVRGTLRELVISRGKSGHIALYRYDEARDVARVLAIRHQREAGYSPS